MCQIWHNKALKPNRPIRFRHRKIRMGHTYVRFSAQISENNFIRRRSDHLVSPNKVSNGETSNIGRTQRRML